MGEDQESEKPANKTESEREKTKSPADGEFITISHHPNPPSVVIQYGTPVGECSCTESKHYTGEKEGEQRLMRARNGSEKQINLSIPGSPWQLDQGLVPGNSLPSLSGQVYFGDAYHYKQYLDLRFSAYSVPMPQQLSPSLPTQVYGDNLQGSTNVSGCTSNLLAPEPRVASQGFRSMGLSSQYQPYPDDVMIEQLSNRLNHPDCRLELPEHTSKMELENQSSCSYFGPSSFENRSHIKSGPHGPKITDNSSNNDMSNFLTKRSQKLDIASVLQAPTIQKHPDFTSAKDTDDVLSPSLLSSAFDLTPPISNTSETHGFEEEPQLVLPDVRDSCEMPDHPFLTFRSCNMETPPRELDELDSTCLFNSDMSSFDAVTLENSPVSHDDISPVSHYENVDVTTPPFTLTIPPPASGADVVSDFTPDPSPVKVPTTLTPSPKITNKLSHFGSANELQAPVDYTCRKKENRSFQITEPYPSLSGSHLKSRDESLMTSEFMKKNRKRGTKPAKRTKRISKEKPEIPSNIAAINNRILEKVMEDTFLSAKTPDMSFDESIFLGTGMTTSKSSARSTAREYKHLVNFTGPQSWHNSADVSVRILPIDNQSNTANRVSPPLSNCLKSKIVPPFSKNEEMANILSLQTLNQISATCSKPLMESQSSYDNLDMSFLF